MGNGSQSIKPIRDLKSILEKVTKILIRVFKILFEFGFSLNILDY